MFSKTHLSILSVFGKVNCLPIFVSTYCPRKLGHRIIIYRFHKVYAERYTLVVCPITLMYIYFYLAYIGGICFTASI